MSNSDQISSRLLALHQTYSELVEQFEQLKILRKKLRTAEKRAATQTLMISASHPGQQRSVSIGMSVIPR